MGFCSRGDRDLGATLISTDPLSNIGPRKETLENFTGPYSFDAATILTADSQKMCHTSDIKSAAAKIRPPRSFLPIFTTAFCILFTRRDIDLRDAFFPARIPYLDDTAERGVIIRFYQERNFLLTYQAKVGSKLVL